MAPIATIDFHLAVMMKRSGGGERDPSGGNTGEHVLAVRRRELGGSSDWMCKSGLTLHEGVWSIVGRALTTSKSDVDVM